MTLTKHAAICCVFIASAAPSFAVSIFSGEPTEADAAAARANWEASVASFTTDNLDGLSGVLGTDTELTTTAGNKFRDGRGTINPNTYDTGPFAGLSLRLDKGFAGKNPGELTWELVSPAFAFGFDIGSQNDGDLGLELEFIDNTRQSYLFENVGTTLSDGSDVSFWGISGLSKAVKQVHLTVPDYGGISIYDNFSYSVAAVPLPGTLPLLFFGLAGGLAASRKSRQRG